MRSWRRLYCASAEVELCILLVTHTRRKIAVDLSAKLISQNSLLLLSVVS